MRKRANFGPRALVAAFITVLAAISCSDSTGPDNTATSVTLEPATATLKLGATVQLTAKGLNAGGGEVAGTPTFTVSDPTVLTVSTTGLVRGIKVGTATVTATFGSVSKSSAITVTVGYPASITKVAGDNVSGIVSTATTPAPSVQVKDSVGNAVEGVQVTFAVASGGGSVTGGTATTNATGTATAGAWTLGSTAGANTLSATVQGATAPLVTVFTAQGVSAAASQLFVATAPAGALAGLPFTTQPVIQVRNAAAGVVTTSTAPVTATISTGGTLIGTTTVNAVAGVARFTDLGVGVVGTYNITFSSTGLAPATVSVQVTQGPALVASPVTITATRGQGEPDGVLTLVTSANSAPITGLKIASITYADTTTGWLAAEVLGTTTPAYVNISAHVGAINPGTYVGRITVSGNGASSVVIPVTLVVQGLPPASISILRQTPGGKTGVVLPIQPQIEFLDPNGLRATQVTDSVTVTKQSGPGTLTGTLTVAAVNGVVTFTDLAFTAPGSYSLLFGAPGLPGVTSGLINVTATGAALVIVTPPAGTHGTTLSTQPVIKLVDSNGFMVTDETYTVTLNVTGPTANGVTLLGTFTATLSNGQAFFSGVTANGIAGNYVFDFSAGSLAPATVTVAIP